MTNLRTLGGIAARGGRCAERKGAYRDRADRLNPNIVLSKRDSYQRRGHLTVSKVGSCRLTLPRSKEIQDPFNPVCASRRSTSKYHSTGTTAHTSLTVQRSRLGLQAGTSTRVANRPERNERTSTDGWIRSNVAPEARAR
jgi:hypothetical protein